MKKYLVRRSEEEDGLQEFPERQTFESREDARGTAERLAGKLGIGFSVVALDENDEESAQVEEYDPDDGWLINLHG